MGASTPNFGTYDPISGGYFNMTPDWKRKCDYCRSIIESGKCPNCGATAYEPKKG